MTLGDGSITTAFVSGVGVADWRAELASYRQLVASGWTPKTVHRRFADADQSPSAGQCGVTSAWLMAVLRYRHSVPAVYCYGDVRAVRESAEDLLDHCWLEIGDEHDPDRTVVDLTCDQAAAFADDKVLCSSHRSIRSVYGMSYDAALRREPAELEDDEVQDRLGMLVRELGPDQLPVVPPRLRRFF
ncbi:hypothetical protein ACFV9C_21585 [Kribbella sp. NPDC059898]|uniref:hypothetical protein n=1 Tax=Kribbella sp. NPDC059898 TaxID=3346995 RepID=UPI00366896C4